MGSVDVMENDELHVTDQFRLLYYIYTASRVVGSPTDIRLPPPTLFMTRQDGIGLCSCAGTDKERAVSVCLYTWLTGPLQSRAS